VAELTELLHRAHAILFDFDGPICSVFAGHPAHLVARDLRVQLARRAIDVRVSEAAANDPLEVLRTAAIQGGLQVAKTADELLTEAEIAAVEVAAPTPAGIDSLAACAASGRLVAVVSNNSAAAVSQYLARHRATHLVQVVVGREYGRPDLMKPHPKPIIDALRGLGVGPNQAVLVGDSPADLAASRAAGVTCVGYAATPAKRALLADADLLIDDMQVLATGLTKLTRDDVG